MACKTCRGSGYVQLGDCPDPNCDYKPSGTSSSETSSDRPIVLKLTRYQAEVLRTTCGWIGGNPDGPRGAMDSIRDMLKRANVKYFKCRATGSVSLEPGEPE